MGKSILFINACVRKESRTMELAKKLLAKIDKPYKEVCLENINFPVVKEEYLNKRDNLISKGDFDNQMFDLAREFAKAETIVIAAPFWDLSFPAMLKQYLEQINVVGITFKYSKEGIPVGLCKANKLYYVTTAGGHFVPEEFGFGYVKALSQSYYGIMDVEKIEAVGLDIDGADVDAIINAVDSDLLNGDGVVGAIFKPGDIVKHFKRETLSEEEKKTDMYLYKIIGVAEHTETKEKLMVYKAMYDKEFMCARPLDMFLSEVDHYKYPDIKQKYRFEKI